MLRAAIVTLTHCCAVRFQELVAFTLNHEHVRCQARSGRNWLSSSGNQCLKIWDHVCRISSGHWRGPVAHLTWCGGQMAHGEHRAEWRNMTTHVTLPHADSLSTRDLFDVCGTLFGQGEVLGDAMALLRLLLLLVSADAGPGCVVGNCAKELARRGDQKLGLRGLWVAGRSLWMSVCFVWVCLACFHVARPDHAGPRCRSNPCV